MTQKKAIELQELERRMIEAGVPDRKKEILRKERPVLKKNVPTGKICPPGYDYCWQCGHIAPFEDFLKEDKCPNPSCPRPEFWDD